VTTRILAALALAAAVTACPNWNRPACVTPNSFACVADQPRWCSTTRELTPIGDEPCGRTGRACVVHADGVAACEPVADGGAQ
jgi:hypothetical protein